MFDYAGGGRQPERSGTARAISGGVTVLIHVAIVGAVVAAIYTVDQLPEVTRITAFVAPEPVVPPSPPDPPPPPKVEPRPPARTSPAVANVPRVPTRPDIPLVAAPLEAPPTIAPESGYEGIFGQRRDDPPGEGAVPTSGIAGGVGIAPAGPPPAPKAVRIGGNISTPKLLRRIDPEYPIMAQRAQVQGIVVLEASVDTTGRVRAVKALRAHPLLERAAIDAVEQWQYEPLMLNGVATPFVLTVTVSFSIGTT